MRMEVEGVFEWMGGSPRDYVSVFARSVVFMCLGGLYSLRPQSQTGVFGPKTQDSSCFRPRSPEPERAIA